MASIRDLDVSSLSSRQANHDHEEARLSHGVGNNASATGTSSHRAAGSFYSSSSLPSSSPSSSSSVTIASAREERLRVKKLQYFQRQQRRTVSAHAIAHDCRIWKTSMMDNSSTDVGSTSSSNNNNYGVSWERELSETIERLSSPPSGSVLAAWMSNGSVALMRGCDGAVLILKQIYAQNLNQQHPSQVREQSKDSRCPVSLSFVNQLEGI